MSQPLRKVLTRQLFVPGRGRAGGVKARMSAFAEQGTG